MSPTFRRLSAVSTLALTAALAAPMPALAQTNDGVFTMLGRIILGAGRARVAIDTPQAVTVLEAEELEREQADTPGDLLRSVPGVQAWGGAAMTGQLLNIRGIGTFSQSDENRIIVTIDGVQKYNEQYNMGSQFGEPDLYRRVEVLRGPASSLMYGSGAIGGVVAFETRDASDFLTVDSDTALRLRGSGASNGNGFSGSAILAHRFNDRVEVLAAITTRHEGPTETSQGTVLPDSEMDAQSILLSGTIRLSDESEQTLRFSATRWRTEGTQVPYSVTRNLPVFGLADRTIIDDTVQVTWENPASDNPWVNARIQLSYSNTQTEQRNATGIPGNPSALFDDADYGYETLKLDARNTIEAHGANWANYLTLGASLSRFTRVAQTYDGAGGPGLPLTFHAAGESDTAAIYLQNEFILNDRLTLLGALRFDRSESVATGGALTSIGVPVTHSGTSASLAVHYQINEAWGVFGSVSDTARLPSIDELFSYTPPRAGSYETLRPEQAMSYELGFAWQGRDIITGGDGLDVKVTAFRSDITDRIAVGPLGTGLPQYVNTAQSRIEGIEFEASYQSERWFGRLAASRINGRDQLTGLTLTSTPAPELMLEVGHRLPQHEIEFGWRGTFTRSIEYSPTLTVPGASVHDLFLTWAPSTGVMRNTTVQLAVHNITDEYYFNALDVAANGYAGAYPQRGRDLRLTLGRTFNF
ncbi:MAG: TonB-dependent receptor domain-containing protein [Pararhodobacter sp.]